MTVRPSAEMDLTPRPEHRFTFGLWTVGNPGRDPFGGPTRPPLDPVTSVERLAELGAYGVSLHDNDLVHYGASAAERDQIVARFTDALQRTGLCVTMATTNLFTHLPARTGRSPPTTGPCGVRRSPKRCGASISAPSSARRSTSSGVGVKGRSAASKRVGDALERYREAINFLSGYVRDQRYSIRFAIEPKPNEPRVDIFLPTVHTQP